MDGAVPFFTSSLTFRMVCCSVRMLSISCGLILFSAVVGAVARSALNIS